MNNVYNFYYCVNVIVGFEKWKSINWYI